MSKYSKGKWKLKIWRGDGGEPEEIEVSCGSTSVHYAGDLDGESDDEHIANARLIAASPEMLATLKEAQDHLGISMDNALDRESRHMLRAVLKRVDTVIAKAEGTDLSGLPHVDEIEKR